MHPWQRRMLAREALVFAVLSAMVLGVLLMFFGVLLGALELAGGPERLAALREPGVLARLGAAALLAGVVGVLRKVPPKAPRRGGRVLARLPRAWSAPAKAPGGPVALAVFPWGRAKL